MLCHAHKGHDTGVPLLKYHVKPTIVPRTAKPYKQRRIFMTLRILQVRSAALHACSA